MGTAAWINWNITDNGRNRPPSEVLIRVGACGLNNTDVNTRTGWYSPSVSGATVAPPGVFTDLLGYIERDEIRPLVAAYPLEKLQEVQQAFINKRHVGNIVVYP